MLIQNSFMSHMKDTSKENQFVQIFKFIKGLTIKKSQKPIANKKKMLSFANYYG